MPVFSFSTECRKIHQSSSLETTNFAVFSIWVSIISILISGILLIIYRKKSKKPSPKAIIYAEGKGLLNRIANYLLLIALTVLPSTVQYPLCNGWYYDSFNIFSEKNTGSNAIIAAFRAELQKSSRVSSYLLLTLQSKHRSHNVRHKRYYMLNTAIFLKMAEKK